MLNLKFGILVLEGYGSLVRGLIKSKLVYTVLLPSPAEFVYEPRPSMITGSLFDVDVVTVGAFNGDFLITVICSSLKLPSVPCLFGYLVGAVY